MNQTSRNNPVKGQRDERTGPTVRPIASTGMKRTRKFSARASVVIVAQDGTTAFLRTVGEDKSLCASALTQSPSRRRRVRPKVKR